VAGLFALIAAVAALGISNRQKSADGDGIRSTESGDHRLTGK
jgi:hypothetical protein